MASEQLIKVATFNARHGAGPLGVFARNRLLVETCRSFDADVIAFQELDRGVIRSWFADQPALIARRLGQQHTVARAKRTPVGGWQCNAITARGPISDIEIVALPGAPGDESRVALVATVSLPALQLSVACTHLQTHGRGVDQLPAALAALDARPEPRVFMGDLNLGPEVVEPVLAAHGYRAVPSGPTIPVAEPKRRIDWVAVAGPLDGVRAITPRPLVSDHRPVVATVSA